MGLYQFTTQIGPTAWLSSIQVKALLYKLSQNNQLDESEAKQINIHVEIFCVFLKGFSGRFWFIDKGVIY